MGPRLHNGVLFERKGLDISALYSETSLCPSWLAASGNQREAANALREKGRPTCFTFAMSAFRAAPYGGRHAGLRNLNSSHKIAPKERYSLAHGVCRGFRGALPLPFPSPVRAGEGCPADAGRGEGAPTPRLHAPGLRYFAPSGLSKGSPFRLPISSTNLRYKTLGHYSRLPIADRAKSASSPIVSLVWPERRTTRFGPQLSSEKCKNWPANRPKTKEPRNHIPKTTRMVTRNHFLNSRTCRTDFYSSQRLERRRNVTENKNNEGAADRVDPVCPGRAFSPGWVGRRTRLGAN